MANGTGDDTRRSPNLTDLLGMALRYEGRDVADAATGMAALRRICEFRPDVVVLDWMLPDAEGPDVLRRLREAPPRSRPNPSCGWAI